MIPPGTAEETMTGSSDRLEEMASKTLDDNTPRDRLIAPNEEIEPRDEWERLIIRIGTNCGVSLPHEALSSEGLYE